MRRPSLRKPLVVNGSLTSTTNVYWPPRRAPQTHVRLVTNNFNFVDQLLLRATRLVSSGRQSAAALLIKEAAVEEGGSSLGRLITEIGRAARAGWAPTARLIVLLAVAAAAVALVLTASR
jgi:hypothetical protein